MQWVDRKKIAKQYIEMCAEDKKNALAKLVPGEAPITGGSSGSGAGPASAGGGPCISSTHTSWHLRQGCHDHHLLCCLCGSCQHAPRAGRSPRSCPERSPRLCQHFSWGAFALGRFRQTARAQILTGTQFDQGAAGQQAPLPSSGASHTSGAFGGGGPALRPFPGGDDSEDDGEEEGKKEIGHEQENRDDLNRCVTRYYRDEVNAAFNGEQHARALPVGGASTTVACQFHAPGTYKFGDRYKQEHEGPADSGKGSPDGGGKGSDDKEEMTGSKGGDH